MRFVDGLNLFNEVGETAFLDMFGFPQVFKGMLSHQNQYEPIKLKQLIQKFS